MVRLLCVLSGGVIAALAMLALNGAPDAAVRAAGDAGGDTEVRRDSFRRPTPRPLPTPTPTPLLPENRGI